MKLNIHKKVLILVLGAGLTTFLVLGIFSYFGKNIVQRDMMLMSFELGEKSASYTGNLLTEQLKQTLGELTKAKAQFIDREMYIIKEDATILANAVTEIMSHPEDYLPKTLPDPRTDPIHNDEPYRIYAPDIRDNVTPEIQRELELAANIKDIMAETLKDYEGYNATAFVGGEKGWYICSRLVVDENGATDFTNPIYFSHERIYEFDPRKRPWYISAKRAGKPVISDLYRTIEANGYQQIGASAPFYDAAGNLIGVAGLDYNNTDFYKWINDFTDSRDNANFVLNDRGEVIFSTQTSGIFAVNVSDDLVARNESRDLRNSSESTLAEAAKKMVAGEQDVLPIKLDGENFYISFAPMPETGWRFGMVVKESEIFSATKTTRDYFQEQVANLQAQMRQEYSYMNKLVVGVPVVLLIILFLMSTGLARRFVKPIHELSDGVRDIASGNIDKKLDIQTGDEIEHLAACFNAMTDELKTYMENLTKATAERERLATELDVAREIQRGMLPKDFPARADFELYATMTPAKEVGGDFYDFYFLDEKHLAITVADVSGKGISAALFMVISKTILNNFAASFYKQNGLAPVVAAANEQLCANNEAMMFVTVFIGVLDLETGEFTYVNGGHNPPVVYRAEENHCDFLDVKKNFVLGPMDGIPFFEQKISLKRGDLLFLYTDGVTEALNVAEEEYLPERLIAFMNSTDCAADLKTLLKNIRGDVAAHVGTAEQSDDITMFALRFKGGGKA
ncbi:MAG: SpoIIE family protein phosphatase [Selenomonadaceae bacterium]|nr:SpoIIE family protein phosphatase [Selenomonadaceae bacterium]